MQDRSFPSPMLSFQAGGASRLSTSHWNWHGWFQSSKISHLRAGGELETVPIATIPVA